MVFNCASRRLSFGVLKRREWNMENELELVRQLPPGRYQRNPAGFAIVGICFFRKKSTGFTDIFMSATFGLSALHT